jgi:hypothetical protein
LSRIPIYPPERSAAAEHPSVSAVPASPTIQPKLEIGGIDDSLEHEAERVADQVMRMPDPAVSVYSAPPQISRKMRGLRDGGRREGEAASDEACGRGRTQRRRGTASRAECVAFAGPAA